MQENKTSTNTQPLETVGVVLLYKFSTLHFCMEFYHTFVRFFS